MEKCLVIAELCCNHNGSVELCKQMIKEAKEAGAYAVKLQKRDNDLWREKKPHIFNNPHPNPKNSYGETYYDHRKFLEFDAETHKMLAKYSREIGIGYGCSVWDIKSAQEIIALNPDFIKIASTCNNNYELLEFVCKSFDGEIHISLGMTTRAEFDKMINILEKEGALSRVVLYICTSGYPVEPKDINLLDIAKLKADYGKKCKMIGFSTHQTDLYVDIAAYSLGAGVIEHHFTLDKTMKGTDHQLSVTPDELRTLTAELEVVRQAMGERQKAILDVEISNKEKLKWQ